MESIEEHVSPDGLLKLIVTRDEDGDLSLGFDNFEWHTHADMLAEFAGIPEETAVRQFIDDLLEDRKVIVVSRVQGAIKGVWVTDEPEDEHTYKQEQETLELRLWSGLPWKKA